MLALRNMKMKAVLFIFFFIIINKPILNVNFEKLYFNVGNKIQM